MKEATLQRLAAIQPIRQFRYLSSQIVEALAEETGVPASDAVYAPLIGIEVRADLAQIDWGSLSLSLGAKATGSADAAETALDFARLLLDRAEVQAALYADAKHFFTLSLTTSHRYRFPRPVPRKKLSEFEDFNYFMRAGDAFLDRGRSALQQFEQLLFQGASFSQMRATLNQAYEQYVAYRSAREQGNRIYEALCADLTTPVHREKEALVA